MTELTCIGFLQDHSVIGCKACAHDRKERHKDPHVRFSVLTARQLRFYSKENHWHERAGSTCGYSEEPIDGEGSPVVDFYLKVTPFEMLVSPKEWKQMINVKVCYRLVPDHKGYYHQDRLLPADTDPYEIDYEIQKLKSLVKEAVRAGYDHAKTVYPVCVKCGNKYQPSAWLSKKDHCVDCLNGERRAGKKDHD